MSSLEHRLTAPPALPPRPPRPPRGRGGDDGEPPGWDETPLWRKPTRNLSVLARVGVKFPTSIRDTRTFTAKTLPLTTCVVAKIIPAGARRSAAIVNATGYCTHAWAPKYPKKLPKFKTKAEAKRYKRRWLHGFTREREYVLIGANHITLAPARDMLEKTRWTVTLKLQYTYRRDTHDN